MIPRDRSGINLRTLDCLELEAQKWAKNSKVVVLGDFNARVGELPNGISDPDEEAELKCIRRTSVDKTVTPLGRKI